MEVVGRDDLDVQVAGDLDQFLVQRAVVPGVAEVEAVVLDLHVEVVAEDVLEGLGPTAGVVEVVVQDPLLDDALHAGALADEALVVLLEHGQRGAGLVVHHLVAGGDGHALHQVVVARGILGQENQVVAGLLGALLDAVVGDEVGLAAKDGLDERCGLVGTDGLERRVLVGLAAVLLPDRDVGLPLAVGEIMDVVALGVGVRLLELPILGEALDVVAPLPGVLLPVVVLAALQVEVGDAEHVAVVGQRDGRHLEVDGALDHVGDARSPVEDREVGVVVQVYEGHR